MQYPDPGMPSRLTSGTVALVVSQIHCTRTRIWIDTTTDDPRIRISKPIRDRQKIHGVVGRFQEGEVVTEQQHGIESPIWLFCCQIEDAAEKQLANTA